MNVAQSTKPTDKEISLAWDIHKDADHLLHNRLNAFLVVQALMFGAYFVAMQIPAPHSARSFYYQAIVFAASIVISVGYWWLSQRMIRGILHLKRSYLLPHLPVYECYYRAVDREPKKWWEFWRAHTDTEGSFPDKDPSYPIHQFAPWIFVGVWSLLISLSGFSHFIQSIP